MAWLPGADLDFVAWEAGASHVREWAVVRVPELLQTEAYARALLGGSDRVGDELAVRRRRQQRLVGDSPLRFTVVLDESALRNRVGGPEVMRGQLEHLVESWPAVTVRVLPASVGAGIRAAGFQILDFDHPDDLPVLYAEVPGGTFRQEERDCVDAARRIFDAVRAAALSCEDSRKFVTRLVQA